MNVPSLARDKESSIEAEKPEFYAGKGRGIMEPGIIGIYTCVSNKVSLPRKVKKKKEKKERKNDRYARYDKPDNPFQDGRASLLALVRRPEFVGQLGEK